MYTYLSVRYWSFKFIHFIKQINNGKKQWYVHCKINIVESLLENMTIPNDRERGQLSPRGMPDRLHAKH